MNENEKFLPEFETCFNNFDLIDNETKIFTIELRGSVIICDQDGKEIV